MSVHMSYSVTTTTSIVLSSDHTIFIHCYVDMCVKGDKIVVQIKQQPISPKFISMVNYDDH